MSRLGVEVWTARTAAEVQYKSIGISLANE